MNTVAFFLAGGVLLLVILAKIPGLEHTVRPIIDLVFSLVKVIAEGAFGWTVYVTKLLFASHVEVIQHLTMSAESLDPTHEVREQTEAQ